MAKNIIEDGCRDPLVTWNGMLLDGHNRYEICLKHLIPFNTGEYECENEISAIEWMILNQFGRRNLNIVDRCELALKLKPIWD